MRKPQCYTFENLFVPEYSMIPLLRIHYLCYLIFVKTVGSRLSILHVLHSLCYVSLMEQTGQKEEKGRESNKDQAVKGNMHY